MTSVGEHIRRWRAVRSMSQLALAHAAEVSPRHLSFVETGKSTPSVELLLHLAAQLEVPLRERNTLLLAAGYAPRFDETPLDDPAMRHVHRALRRLLDAHDPYPGVVLDRHHDVVMSNAGADRFFATLPAPVVGPRLNMFRASMHPDGFARDSSDFDQWGRVLLAQLRRMAASGDPVLVELEAEIRRYPNVRRIDDRSTPGSVVDGLAVTSTFGLDGTEIAMFSTLTSFGSPRDITLDDALIELFFPADETSEAALVRRAAAG